MKLFKRIMIIVTVLWLFLSLVAVPVEILYVRDVIKNSAVKTRRAYPELNYLNKVPNQLLILTEKGKWALQVERYIGSANFNMLGLAITSVVCLGLLVVMFTEDREKG